MTSESPRRRDSGGCVTTSVVGRPPSGSRCRSGDGLSRSRAPAHNLVPKITAATTSGTTSGPPWGRGSQAVLWDVSLELWGLPVPTLHDDPDQDPPGPDACTRTGLPLMGSPPPRRRAAAPSKVRSAARDTGPHGWASGRGRDWLRSPPKLGTTPYRNRSTTWNGRDGQIRPGR